MDIARLGIRIDSSGARTAERDLDRFAQAGGRAEKAALGIGAAMRNAMGMAAAAFAGVNVVSTIRDFEAGMAQVKAISGATEAQFKSLRDMAKDLGATTEFTATQVAGGMKFLGQAGFDAAETLTAIPTVLDLATASAVDMATAADIASNILGGFGMEAKDLTSVADKLAKTTSTSNTDLVQLGQALSYAAPLASAAGVSIEESAAAIGKLSDAGIQGSRAGTSLSGVIRRLQNPSKGAADAIREMGLTMEQVDLNGESLAEVMALFAEKGLDAATAATIFEAEAAPGALVMAKNAKAIGEMAAGLGSADGALSAMTKTMRGTIDGSFKGLGSAVEGLIIALGDAGLTSAIKGTVEAFTLLIRGVTQMPDLGAVATGFGLVAAGALAMASPLVAASAAITGLAAGVAFLYQNWDTFAASFPGIAGAISGAVDGIRSAFSYIGERAREAMAGINAAFGGDDGAALKLYLQALALDAKAFGADLVASMLETGQSLGEAIGTWFAGIDFEQAAIDGLTGVRDLINDLTGINVASDGEIAGFVSDVADAVNKVGTGAGAAMTALGAGLSGFLNAFDGASVSRDLMNSIAGGVSALGSAMQGVNALVGMKLASIGAGLKLLFSAFTGNGDPDAFGRWVAGLSEATLIGMGTAFEGFAKGLNVVVQAVNGFAGGDWDGFKVARKEFSEFLSMDGENLMRISAAQAAALTGNLKGALEILQGIKETAPITAQEMSAAADKVLAEMKPGLGAYADLQKALSDYEQGVTDLEALKSRVETLQSDNGGIANSFMQSVTSDNASQSINDVLDLINRVDETATTAAASMQNITGDAAAQVASVSESVANIGTAAETAKANLSALESAAQPIATAVQNVTTTANASLDTLVTDMGVKGTAGITALATGISGGAGAVVSGVEGVTQAALAALAGFASQMETAGRQAMDGLAAGIVAGAESAAKAAADAAAGVIKATKDALDIRSPSRVMAEQGRYAAEGLAQGIEEGSGGVIAATRKIAQAARDEAATLRLAADTRIALATTQTTATAAINAGTTAMTKAAQAASSHAAAVTASVGASSKAAAAKAKEAAATQSAIAGLIQQTERERALIGLGQEAQRELQARWRIEDALNADKLKWSEQQKQGLVDQITLTQRLGEEAKAAAAAQKAGVQGLTGPIFSGLQNGDLTNVGSQIMGNARSSFFSGVQNWMNTGKGGFLGLGTAFKSIGSGTLGGIVSGIMPIAGLISTAVNFFKTTKETLDQGVKLTVSGINASLESWETVRKTRFMGLSSKVSTHYDPYVGDTTGLRLAVKGIQDGVIDAAEALGIGAEAFDGFAYSAKASAKGGDAAAALEAELENMADKFAAMTPGLSKFVRAGEGAADAIEAMAGSLNAFNAVMDTLGLQVADATLASGDMARAIGEAMGGMEAFADAANFYFDRFYSDAEKMVVSVESLTSILTDAGVTAIPRTVAQFRELVSAMSDAGLHEAVAALISAAPAFSDVTDGIEATYNATAKIIDNTLRDVERALSRLDRQGEASAQAFARSLAFLRAGDTSDADALGRALDGISALSEDMFGSAADYRHAQNASRAALENIQSGGETQLDQLKAMVDGLWSVDEGVTSVAQGIALLTAQIASIGDGTFDVNGAVASAGVMAQINAAQRELATLMGQVAPSLLDVNHVNDSGGKEHALEFSDGSRLLVTSGSKRNDTQVLNDEAGTIAAYIATWQTTRDAQAAALRAQIEALGGIPAYAVGTDFHPGGRALVHRNEVIDLPRGSRVHPARYTPDLMGGSDDVVAELRALRREMQDADKEHRRVQSAMLRRIEQLARVQDEWDQIGLPAERTEA
ncbi:phage tail tape measure protein [Sagittula sp. S175]|uniref:phage tail tape measure protein n=1 Tax=Sagittula sp. S175 TaxID=3415129 RepID=UPI003C7AB043